MTYTQAANKIKEIERAIKKVVYHMNEQFYYNNSHWKSIIKKLEEEKAKLEELIHNEELEEYDPRDSEVSEEEAKTWGIKIIKI